MNSETAKTRSIPKLALKWVFILYVIPTSFVGVWLSFNYFYKYVVYDNTPVQFRNGFIYTAAPSWIKGGKVVLYPDGRLAVENNVRYVEENGDFIYGYRKVKSGQSHEGRRYFICKSGKDCSQTQNYREAEFEKALKENGLPYFSTAFFNPLKSAQVKEWIGVHLFLKNKASIPNPLKKETASDKRR